MKAVPSAFCSSLMEQELSITNKRSTFLATGAVKDSVCVVLFLVVPSPDNFTDIVGPVLLVKRTTKSSLAFPVLLGLNCTSKYMYPKRGITAFLFATGFPVIGFPLESVPMTGKMNWDGFELNLASYTVMPACGDEHVFRKANLYVGVAQVCCEAPKS